MGVHRSSKQLKFSQIIRIYEKLHPFVLEYDHVFRIVLIAGKVCLISLATFCTCGVVRSHGVLALFLLTFSILSMCSLVIYLMLLGELNHQSRLFFKTIKMHLLTKYACSEKHKKELARVQRYLLTMRELKVQMGSIYYVDKPIVLTTFKIMFDIVVNFVIIQK